ncbi:hypothetical protein [Streptomyces buecherae]|uniref:hypothetical protein n=1 Tax=Streptomyces buecherae TaxID=2763006 RepID=UPI0037AC27CF
MESELAVLTAIQRSPHYWTGRKARHQALRRGSKKNPSTELLQALAQFFGVPTSYFLDEETARRVDSEIALSRVARNNEVRNLALRALELSPEGLAAVSHIVDVVLRGDTSASARSDE